MNKRNTAISLILPVYNASDYLGECIESIINQSHDDFELICINDSSPDNSQDVIDSYCAKDSRIVSLINPENIGHGASRNRGIKHSTGDYLFHIDPDDTIPETALQKLYSAAEKYSSQLVRGAYYRTQYHFDPSLYRPQKISLLNNDTPVINTNLKDYPRLLASHEGHWAFLYRRDIAVQAQYPENLKMGQDAVFITSILPLASSITIIPDVVYNYQANTESAMNKFSLQKYFDVLEWRRQAYFNLTRYEFWDLAKGIMASYSRVPWHDQFFDFYRDKPDMNILEKLSAKLIESKNELGTTYLNSDIRPHVSHFIELLMNGKLVEAEEVILNR